MKKIFTLAAFALFGLSTTFAQTTTTAVKQAPKKAATAVTANVKKADKKAVATGQKLKADGTPDMRYTENKVKAVVAVSGPKKKDGTADMRYKANKPVAKKKM